MISRLVTVDLLLTMSERLRLLPQYRELDWAALYEVCESVLNGWAKRIEAEGLSVSLGAISENALKSFSRPDNQSLLTSIGDRLIDSAGEIEWLLCAKRMTQSLKTGVLLENAANSGNPLPWGEAAKKITGLEKNVTNAGRKLQQFFGHLLSWDNPEEGSAYRKLLTEGINGTKPVIPEQLVPKLKELFLREKKLLRSAGRK
jgi:hypothetical protein